MDVQHTRPNTLYHYTSFTGMKSIIDNHCFWATDIRYLNDFKELTHAIETAENLLREMVASDAETLKSLEYIWSLTIGKSNAFFPVSGLEPVVVSMSENGDQLSQWRGYCPQGQGVSIGFDSTLFDGHCVGGRARFSKCIYEPEMKTALIRELLVPLISAFQTRTPLLDADNISESLGDFATALFLKGVYLKHESFSEESEWRYSSVYSSLQGRNLKSWKFRISHMGLIPYVEIPFAEEPLPIKEIIVSPSKDSILQVESIKRYLKSVAIDCKEVRVSRIPFRY